MQSVCLVAPRTRAGQLAGSVGAMETLSTILGAFPQEVVLFGLYKTKKLLHTFCGSSKSQVNITKCIVINAYKCASVQISPPLQQKVVHTFPLPHPEKAAGKQRRIAYLSAFYSIYSASCTSEDCNKHPPQAFLVLPPSSTARLASVAADSLGSPLIRSEEGERGHAYVP